MDEKREKDIIARVLRGETAAYAHLVDMHKTAIFNIAYRMTGSVNDADDLAQETFIRAYTSLSSFDTGKKLFAWLYTIALNMTRNHLKKEKRSRMDMYGDRELPAPPAAAQAGCGDDEEMHRKLDVCLLQVSEEMREALILRFYQGLSYSDIAVIAGVSESAAKMRVRRGLEKLHALIAKE